MHNQRLYIIGGDWMQVCKEWQRACSGDAACRHQLAEAAAAAAGARIRRDRGNYGEGYNTFNHEYYLDEDPEEFWQAMRGGRRHGRGRHWGRRFAPRYI